MREYRILLLEQRGKGWKTRVKKDPLLLGGHDPIYTPI